MLKTTNFSCFFIFIISLSSLFCYNHIMKNIFKFIFVFFIFLSANNIFAEEISEYNVDINLHKDSTITVIETIDYDFGNLDRHGIFRFIPINFKIDGQNNWHNLKQRKLIFKNISIKMDGVSENFFIDKKDNNGNLFIKIGDKDKTITGSHKYQIKYDVLGSIRYFKDYDEIYWNAIGLDWKIPINNIEVSLHGNDINFENVSCYSGKLSSSNSCDDYLKEDKSNVVFKQKILQPYEGMTISTSFNKGDVLKREFFSFTIIAYIISVISLFVIFILVILYFLRKYRRKYFTYDPIHPRYTPPEDFNAVLTGYLVDMKFDPMDISSGIIQLAQDGYIKIERIEKKVFIGNSVDYSFVLMKNINFKEINNVEILSLINQSILQLLFSERHTSNLSGNIQSIIQPIKDSLRLDVGKRVLLSDISNKDNKSQYSIIKDNVKKYFIDKNLIEQRNKKGNWYVLLPFGLTFIMFLVGNITFSFILFFITFMSIFLLSAFNLRYTKKGWDTKHSIDGFKLFLEMTDKERYDFFNNPADNPQEFMEYLPYAIALGVEKKWAKQFESITIPQPEWYKGAGPFVASGFANEISSLSNNINSSISKSTISSSGSGSMGGGFSGGGSGGGGGGSW